MPDKNSIKGDIVEPQINEKKLERVPKVKLDLRTRKMSDRTTIYEKLVEPLFRDAR